ncbi:T9SS sorting signal type C domain-containing protein [Flavobacterium sp.]|uniref:T9SS sorting signal type C domain-containing protein n=1 Tax=Flavobacterium sp. TaxID=239 RepID=UPI002617F883|nr:T9SS sorting signal type C domain-containing protein [Flavobacterium sp.]
MKFKIIIVALLFSCFSFGQAIYQNDFGTTAITTKPFVNTPIVFDPNLNSSSWTTSAAGFGGFAGNGGAPSQSLSLSNSSGTPTMTLTFNVAVGYQLSITQFDFWRIRSTTGAQNWSMTVNGTNVGTGTIPTTGATLGVTNVSTPISGLTGTITVVMTYSGASSTGTCRLDDFTLYGSVTSLCSAAATSGTISGTTTACTSTSLSYVGTGSATFVNYWQTSPSGTSFANPASSALTVSTSGSNYVRAYDSTLGCWSNTAVGPTNVTINQPISITTQPANTTVSNGSNTSISVVATNASGYQWYVNTGSGFTPIANGGVYSTATTASLTITGATFAMNGYQYQCLVTGTAPCGNVTSSTAILSVINPLITLADNGTQVTAANAPQGTTNVVLHKFQLTTNVTTNLIGIANVVTTGTYASTDVLNLKVRYSVDNVLDVADATLSTLTNPGVAGTKSFSGFTTQTILASTTGYVFITADVSATAVIGNNIALNQIATTNLVFSTGVKVGSTTNGGLQTFSASPPNAPVSLTLGCTTNTTQVLSWTAPATGTFDGYFLVVREGGLAPHAVTALVASSQINNLDYTLAPTFGSTAPLSKVLYIGTATTVTVTNLTPGVFYTYELRAYKNSGSSSAYSTGITRTKTQGLPNVSSATTSAGNTSGSLTWSNPSATCFDQVLVVVTATSGITFVPSGNTTTAYTPNTVFSTFNQPVFYSSGNYVNITGLTNGVTYYLEIFVRNGSEWSSGVEVSITPINVVPTVLKTGDLFLIAYNNTFSGANDAIRLLTLVDINPGTKFLWANGTYETGGNPAANVRTDKWFDCTTAPTGNIPYLEFTYIGSSVIPAASTFCIETVSAGTTSTISGISPLGTVFPNTDFTIICKSADGSTNLSHGTVNVSSSSPDSMFLMQGNFSYAATGSTFSGTVLSGIQDGGLWYDLTDDLTLTTGNNLRKSRKHPQLLCASIQGNLTPNTYQVSYNVSSSTYTTGNRPYLLGSILNYTTNWINAFGSCPATSPFVITASDPFNRWTGNISTNWFDCNNWALLTVPDELTDVSILASAARDAVIDYTAPYSDGFSDVAKCKALTISGRKVQIEANPFNKLEVHENLVIDTSGVLDMDDSNASTTDGLITLYGNWTNNVGTTAFLEGNGTINFVGSSTQVVNSNVHSNTETFYNVILDNDFNTASSNNLIATGNLEVKTNKILTINSNDYTIAGKKLTNYGDILIANNGQLIQVDEADNNDGDYTGTKFQLTRTAQAKSLDYVYWSSPTENFAVSNLPNNYRYQWNTLNNNGNGTLGNWVNAAGTMTKGRGYIARASNGSATAVPLNTVFTGKPHNGQFNYQIFRGNYTGADYDADLTNATNLPTTAFDDNWNLVGNPYPSAIDAMEFINLNTATNNVKMVGAIWIWKHGINPSSNVSPFYQNFALNYSPNDYIKFNAMGSSEPTMFTNGKIASGQGFMINMSDELSPGVPNPSGSTITFTNGLRTGPSDAVYDNTDFFRPSNATVGQPEERHRIWLDIVNTTSGDMDRTLLGYATNATLGVDNLYDCFTRPKSEISLYSLIDNKPYAIQGRALPFDTEDRVPMGINVVQSGNHTVAINTVDGLFLQNQDIYLEDKVLNIIHDLKQAPYNFTSAVGTYNDRFVLRYTTAALNTQNFDTIDSSVVVAANEGQIAIKSVNELLLDVTVYDVLGRQLLSKTKIELNDLVLNSISARNQALIVKIKLANGTIITRKVVL